MDRMLDIAKHCRLQRDFEPDAIKKASMKSVLGVARWQAFFLGVYMCIYIYILRLPTRATGRHGMSHESDYACATQQALVIALFWS